MSNEGMLVSTHYIGTLDDGTVFDSSYERNEPIDFVCMKGTMIKGYDKAVVDMEVGETKTVRIPAAEAYGEYDPTRIQKIPVEFIPNAKDLPVGETVAFQTPYGPMIVKVVGIEDGMVVLDENHELAGKDLTFEITLVSVSEAPANCGGSCSSCGGGCC